MSTAGYESWFVSARDPHAGRALWIRHTRHRARSGLESAALWCTVVDRDTGGRPVAVKQVTGALPAGAAAGPRRFTGSAALGQRSARWDLAVISEAAPLPLLRPQLLYRAPLPRTKVVASVPDGLVTGLVAVDGRELSVSSWRGTVGHNWGSEHADTWVWLHAADFDGVPDCWLELVLARIMIGPVRSPWTATGWLGLGGERLPLGGLGRRPRVDAQPGRLTAAIPSPRAQLRLTVTSSDDDAVAVRYADPSGGHRTVRHAALAAVDLTLRRQRGSDVALTTSRGAYEYGTSQDLAGMVLEPLPDG